MDWKLKTYRRKLLRRPNSDRLTSLPDELLGQILSMLPTKDAAATLILSKRMGNGLSWMTNFDLDDSPISHCIKYPHLVERFPLFESFVDNLLMKFSPPNAPDLTRFRLHFGGDFDSHYHGAFGHTRCNRNCYPDVVPARLNEWISYPLVLAHGGGLTELDLSFYVRKPYEFELPPSLFTCQSLHMLKLESNLEIDDARIPMINLPNLKRLHLDYVVFNDDDFVTRLVSSCPILEDLSLIRCLWKIGDCVSISSHSLQSLALLVRKSDYRLKSSKLLSINTPNLLYVCYGDFFATRYSIAPMNSLVKASIEIIGHHNHFETQLSFVTAASHVMELSLLGYLVKNLYFAGELREQLPMFHNLRTLELDGFQEGRWDIVLLLILNRAPSLETLVFVEGLFLGIYAVYAEARHSDAEEAALEAEGWKTALAIPSCRCFTHLKRIVVKCCFGSVRELNTIKFLLAKSYVLEELVLYLSTAPRTLVPDPPNLDQFVNNVKEFPRASNSCLISVRR